MSDQEPTPRPRRWRLTFGLRTLFVLMTIVCLAVGWPHLERWYLVHHLAGFANRDFKSLPDNDALWVHAAIKKLGRGSKYDEFEPFGSPYGQTLIIKPGSGRAYLLLLRSTAYMSHPGECRVYVTYLNGAGHEIGEWEFSTGWRVSIDKLTYSDTDRLYPVIAVETDGDARRQFYAIGHDGPKIVRVENDRGVALPLAERRGAMLIPPGPPWEEWKSLLSSSDPTEQMQALATLPYGVIDWQKQPEVLARFEKLAQSTDDWVAEAACLFLNEMIR